MGIALVDAASSLKLVTSASGTVDVTTSWRNTGGQPPSGAKDVQISTATTTEIVPSGIAEVRNVDSIGIRNAHASTSNDVTVQRVTASGTFTLYMATLAAGEACEWSEAGGWKRYGSTGVPAASAVGGAAAGAWDFPDNVFNAVDPSDATKKTRLDSGNVTTATTRVLTMADRDVDLDYAIQRAVVSVTAGQLLALRATPKTLVAAPGVGKFLEFVSALLRINFVVAHDAPTNAGDDLGIRYTNGSGQVVATQEATGFINAAANAIRILKGGAAPAATATDIVPVDNAALVLHNVGAAEFPGAGTSTMTVEVFYRVRTSAPS